MSDEPIKPRQPQEPAGPTASDGQPDAPAQATTPLDQPAPEQPTPGQPAPGQTGETTTEHGAAAPPPPPPAPPVPPAAPRQPGGFGRFARHRATQIVAAGLIGLVIGGGVVALVDRDGPRGGGYGYHGQFDRGPRGDFGPGQGPGFRDGGPGGNGGQRQQRPQRQAPTPPNAPSTPSTPSTPPSTTTPS